MRKRCISVEHLSKSYCIYARPMDALKEMFMRTPRHTEFRALDDITFHVHEGERVGILGRNGAGKSTLLKILAGTLDHTGGRFDVSGHVRAILELGTGFHEDRTGRENILLGGLCMGYEEWELRKQFEWIVTFTELQRVIDQPLRTYSSGMKARLMFAVAFCLGAELLIVDEALATGDVAFVRKCANHLLDLCNQGSTVFIVSHNLYLLERFCDRILYLKEGRLVGDGAPQSIIRQYETDLGEEFIDRWREAQPPAPHVSLFREANAFGERTTVDGSESDQGPSRPAPVGLPGAQPSARPRNGKGLILTESGQWQEFDFTGAPPVRHLNLVKLLKAEMLDASGRPVTQIMTGAEVRLRFTVESRVRKKAVHAGLIFTNEQKVLVTTTTNTMSLGGNGAPNSFEMDLESGIIVAEVRFPSLRLGVGRYTATFGFGPGWEHFSEEDVLLYAPNCLAFAVLRPGGWHQVFYEPTSEWQPLRKTGELAELTQCQTAVG